MHTVQNDIILACIQGFNDTFNIIIINIFRAAGYDIGRKFARFNRSCLAGGFGAGDAPLEKIWNSKLAEMGFPAIWTTKLAPLSCLQAYIFKVGYHAEYIFFDQWMSMGQFAPTTIWRYKGNKSYFTSTIKVSLT